MSLIDIELKANWLHNQLQKSMSTRLKILSVCNFFSEIINEKDQSKFTSFYLQFKDELFYLIKKEQFKYFSPDEIEILSSICIKIFTFLNQIEVIEKELILNILRNAKNRIETILNNKLSNEDVSIDAYSINHVLIESDETMHLNTGIVEKLFIEISRNDQKKTGDNISFDGIVKNNSDELSKEIKKILNIVKSNINEIIKKNSSYKFTLSFEEKEYSYNGISIGAATAILIYNSILKSELYKTYYKFKHDVVIGSAIDNEGYLIPLDKESLKVKLRTVFFSTNNKFVLPEENIIDARCELEVLNAQFPKRKLDLLPIRHYLQIFRNLDIVEVHKLKIREKVKANYNRYHSYVNLILSFVILVIMTVLTFNIFIPNLDNNPVYTSIADNRFVAFNKYGKSIWKSDLLNAEDKQLAHSWITRDRRILVNDIDGDGKNEILYLREDFEKPILSRTLFCCAGDGKLKWKFIVPKRENNYGDDECSDKTIIDGMNIFYNKTTKRKEIILSSHVCELFPEYLIRIDNEGKQISEMYHPGHVNYVKIIDIDNDGNYEIVAGGVNNDFEKHAFIAVIDPNNLSGSSPGRRLPINVKVSPVKKYILLPKTELCNFSLSKLNKVSFFEFNENQLSVYVNENELYDPNKPLSRDNDDQSVIYTFDRNMKPISFGTSSEWDAKFNELLAQKKVKPIINWKKYKDSILDEIKYWDGEKFVKYSNRKPS